MRKQNEHDDKTLGEKVIFFKQNNRNQLFFTIFSIKPFTDVYKIYDVTNARRIGSGGFGKVRYNLKIMYKIKKRI